MNYIVCMLLFAVSPTEKMPIPASAVQQKALTSIREVYQDDYKDKNTLAQKFIQKAKKTEDYASRYVLLHEAKSIALEMNQLELAFQAIDAMAAEYEVSAAEIKSDIIDKVAKKSRLTPKQRAIIAEMAMHVIDDAVHEDNYDVAKHLSKQVGQLARTAKDKELFQSALAKYKEVESAAKAYENIQDALTTLKDNPKDATSNAIVGKYICFHKDDWKQGLPMLAIGSNDELKALANKDVADPKMVTQQVELGDEWWNIGGKQRAMYWYEKAMPSLKGLEKDRIKKRLSQTDCVRRFTFTSTNALSDFLPVTKSKIQDAALIVSPGDLVLYKQSWKNISSVSVVGGIVPPGKCNFRMSVGPINVILNWEGAPQNHIRDVNDQDHVVTTNPPAIIPGKMHRINIIQDGDVVIVTVDDKELYKKPGSLSGTVCIYPSGDNIAIKEMVIKGKPDYTTQVTKPSHRVF